MIDVKATKSSNKVLLLNYPFFPKIHDFDEKTTVFCAF
jgi:hypothetical protein